MRMRQRIHRSAWQRMQAGDSRQGNGRRRGAPPPPFVVPALAGPLGMTHPFSIPEEPERRTPRAAAPFRRDVKCRSSPPARPARKPGHVGAYRLKVDHNGCNGACAAGGVSSRPRSPPGRVTDQFAGTLWSASARHQQFGRASTAPGSNRSENLLRQQDARSSSCGTKRGRGIWLLQGSSSSCAATCLPTGRGDSCLWTKPQENTSSWRNILLLCLLCLLVAIPLP